MNPHGERHLGSQTRACPDLPAVDILHLICQARNNARCTQARKTTLALDGQHQDVDRTPRGRVSQNDREDKDKWRKYVHGVAKPRVEDG